MLFLSLGLHAQVKVSGIIVDEDDNPVPFANIIFKGSTYGTISNENGKFYLESDQSYRELEVSFVGFETRVIPLEASNLDLRIALSEARDQLDEVMIYTGKMPKKNNPAVDILKKIWRKKRRNGLYLYDRYEYDKYEKIQFDLNNIDEKLMNRKVFDGLEMVCLLYTSDAADD